MKRQRRKRLQTEQLEDRRLLASDIVVYDINEGPISSSAGVNNSRLEETDRLHEADGKLYFAAFDPQTGNELRWLDLETQQISTVDIRPGTISSGPGNFGGFISANDKLFFTAGDATHGTELRWIDTTAESPTVNTFDITPGSAGSFRNITDRFGGTLVGYVGLTLVGDKLYFVSHHPTDDLQNTLHWIDTAQASPVVNTVNLATNHTLLTGVGDKLYFGSRDATYGNEPRWIDTTVSTPSINTVDIAAGGLSSLFGDPESVHDNRFLAVGDRLYVGTRGLHWIDTATSPSSATSTSFTGVSDYRRFTYTNDKLYFLASDSANGHELRWLDTSATSPSLNTLDVYPGSRSGTPSRITPVGDKLFFGAVDPLIGLELFWIDTNSNSPVPSSLDVFPGGIGSAAGFISDLVAYGDTLYFRARDAGHGEELRSIDWTSAAPSINTIDIDQSATSTGSFPSSLTLIGNELFMSANVEGYGFELVSLAVGPVASHDSYTVDEDSVLSVAVAGLLENDRVDAGNNLSLSTAPVSGPSHGALTLHSDGSFEYTPNVNFTGTDSFVYEVQDDNGRSDTATVTIEVEPVNDEPVVSGPVISSAVESDAEFTVDLLAGASDPDGDTIAVADLTLVGGDDTGVTIVGNTVSIDPSEYAVLSGGQNEVIEYSYIIDDGNGGQTPQTATITVFGEDAEIGIDVAQSEVTASECSTPTNSGTWTGSVSDPSTAFFASVGTVEGNADGTWAWSLGSEADFIESQIVTITFQGDGDATASTSFALVVGDSFSGVRLHTNGELRIVGTSERDVIHVNPHGSKVRVVANFGGSNPTEYHSFSLSEVQRIYVSACDGDDHIQLHSRLDLPSTILGNNGNDWIRGGRSTDSIFGGSGNDFIDGSGGDDVLVGGIGRDNLNGGTGDDLLIGAALNMDNQLLQDIHDIWGSSAAYVDRADQLTGLVLAHHQDDEETDTMRGHHGADLFFADLAGIDKDRIRDRRGLERAVDAS